MLDFEGRLISNNPLGLSPDQLEELEKALTSIRKQAFQCESEEQLRLCLQNHQKVCLALASELPDHGILYHALLFWLEKLFPQHLNNQLSASSFRTKLHENKWKSQFYILHQELKKAFPNPLFKLVEPLLKLQSSKRTFHELSYTNSFWKAWLNQQMGQQSIEQVIHFLIQQNLNTPNAYVYITDLWLCQAQETEAKKILITLLYDTNNIMNNQLCDLKKYKSCQII